MNELNVGVVVYEVQDWTSNVLGVYDNLMDAEERQNEIVLNTEDVKVAHAYLKLAVDYMADDKVIKDIQDLIEAVETSCYEDLYIIGKDKEGNVVPVDFG